MFKIKENDLFKKNMNQGELYKVYKTFKAKQEMDKFLNKLITKNGTTKYQYEDRQCKSAQRRVKKTLVQYTNRRQKSDKDNNSNYDDK